jgi:hypothetical protein
VRDGKASEEGKKISKEELALKRGRWLWYAGAATAMIGYLLGSGIISIEFGGAEDDDVDTRRTTWEDLVEDE